MAWHMLYYQIYNNNNNIDMIKDAKINRQVSMWKFDIRWVF